jgi:ubiquitin-protein ligase
MTTASVRLSRELDLLNKNPVDNVTFELKDDNNILLWNFLLFGPHGSPYEGGIYTGEIKFPHDYPVSPPVVRFISKLFHPNVYPDGNLCISILHTGNDVSGYEHELERWRPIQNVRTIFVSILSLLHDPNPDSAANIDAAKLLRENKKAYCLKIRQEQEEQTG